MNASVIGTLKMKFESIRTEINGINGAAKTKDLISCVTRGRACSEIVGFLLGTPYYEGS